MSKPTGKLIRLTAGDVGAYTKAETDTKVADAKKAGTDAQATANAANTAATNANNNANGRVPSARKVNNKPLTTDINLTAGDVGAYTKAETDTKVADAKKAGTDAQSTANAANTAATNANNNANGRVPSGRKVNNKPLTADISLNAGDVGALTQAQGDGRYVQKTGNGNGGIGTYRYKQRLIYTITNWAGDFTVTLPESLTGRLVGITNNVHRNSMSVSTLIPADGIEFVVSSVDGNSTMVQASAGGTKLKFYGRVYFDPTRIYVWE